MIRRLASILVFTVLICVNQGCGIYSFTGANVCAECKTVTVSFFQNYAPLASPTLSQTFTEDLRDIMISQTNLALVGKNGDLQFEGSITDYNTKPVAIQGNETAALNRLTISVKVKFTNTKKPDDDFEQVFTRFTDYDSSQEFAQVEESLIEEVNSQLTQDIFNKALSNW